MNDLLKDFEAESGSILEQDLESRRPLFGKKEPQYVLQQERYEHRIIAFYKAEGMTNTEIAERSGYTPAAINYIVKQPWMEEMIMEEIHRRGGDAVSNFIKEAALPAAQALAEAVKGVDTAVRDRINAAKAILDRAGYGISSELTIHKGRDLNHLSDDELAKYLTGTSSKTSTGTA